MERAKDNEERERKGKRRAEDQAYAKVLKQRVPPPLRTPEDDAQTWCPQGWTGSKDPMSSSA